MRATLGYQAGLDGIRGLSVAGILLFHSGFAWASGGYLGVSVFLTLSGYLITSLLLAEHTAQGRVRLARFWERRARRLLPIGLAGIGLAAIFAATAGDASQLRRLRGDGLAAIFYVANWRFYLSGQAYESLFVGPSPLLHYWSLGVEEQFYLIHPLLVAGVLRLGGGSRRLLGGVLAGLALASAALSLGLLEAGASPSRVYYGSDTRGAELLVGALLALVCPPRPLTGSRPRRLVAAGGMLALATMLTAFALAPAGSVLDGALPLFSIVSALVVAGALQPGPLRALLAAAPLRALGRISYGVYVIHWPVYLWLDESRTGLAPALLFAFRLAVVLPIAAASFRWLESPIRYGSLAGRRALAASVGGMLLTSSLVLAITRHPPPPAPLEAMLAAPAAPNQVGDSRPPLLALVGGSEAWTLWFGMHEYAIEGGAFRTISLGQPWCGVARGGLRDIGSLIRKYDGPCGEWSRKWREAIGTQHPTAVLLFPSVWDLVDREISAGGGMRGPGDPDFDAWLVSEYEIATDVVVASGASAIWLTMPCVLTETHPGGPLYGNPALSSERTRYLNEQVLSLVLASRPAAEVLDLFGALCSEVPPLSLEPPDSVRPDGLHFSVPGGRVVAEWIEEQLFANPRGDRGHAAPLGDNPRNLSAARP